MNSKKTSIIFGWVSSVLLSLFFVSTVSAQGVQDWFSDPNNPNNSGCIVDGIPTLKCFEIVFGNLLYISSGLIVVTLFIMFVIGSLSYIRSAGNPEKLKKAQGTLMYAIVGTVLFVATYLILNVIDVLFLVASGKLFKFEIPQF